MRTFIAIDLPEAVQAALAQAQSDLRATLPRSTQASEGARWTRPEGVHLTLKFLGEIPPPQLEQLTRALQAIGGFEKIPVEVKGFGFFPEARRPRVLWAGVVAPPALGELARRVEDTLEPLGFARENRPFSPHLTLARFKVPRPQPALQALVERDANRWFGRFEATEFYLFETILSSSGAVYRKVAKFPER